MSTQTAALPDGTTLTKPASGEKVSLSVINTNTDNIANNIILLKSNIDKASHANITGISATGDSNFIIALMTKLNTTYGLSSQSVGVTISGRAEWSGIDYLNFVASKAAPTGWNVLVTGASRIITAYYNASNNSVSSINEVYDKIFPLGYAQTISSATDFNTLLDIKNYVISSNNVATGSANCPSSNAGKLCTWSIDGGSFDRTWAYGGQIYIDIPGREFRRQVTTNGSKVLNFGAWQQLALNSQLTPAYSAVTLASGITGNVVIMRMGKLRVITGYFNLNTSGANITIATLDTQDAPPINIAGNFSGYGVSATGELNITSGGTFQCSVNAKPSNTLKFNLAYAVS